MKSTADQAPPDLNDQHQTTTLMEHHTSRMTEAVYAVFVLTAGVLLLATVV